MKKGFIIWFSCLLALSGCAKLLDGKFVTKEGKESPYKYTPDRYEHLKDPAPPYQP